MGRPPLPLGTWGRIQRTELGPGRWRARAKYRDFDGRTRVVERFDRTGARAERRLQAALQARAAPSRGDLIDRDTSVETLARLWLAEISADNQHTQQTIDVYASAIRVHVLPALGGVRVGEIGVGLIDRFLRARPTAATAKRCRVILTGMLGMAARHDALDHNPVRDAAKRSAERSPVRAMTVAEVAELRANVASWAGGNGHGPARGSDLADILDVMLGTGARIGEVLAIRAEDVRLDTVPATVTITGTIVGNVRQSKPKTDSSHRTMPLPAFAAAALHRQIGRELPTDGTGLVFPSRAGGPRSPANVRRQLREARGEDFAWVTPHTFRKTVATAIERAADIETAAKQLGHSGPDVTRVHYIQRAAIGPDTRSVLEQYAPLRAATDHDAAG